MQLHGDGYRSDRHFVIRLKLADGFQDYLARTSLSPGIRHSLLDVQAAREVGGDIVQLLQAAVGMIWLDQTNHLAAEVEQPGASTRHSRRAFVRLDGDARIGQALDV
ncbi:hypothetical protein D9M69_508520 [compost metagenome]